MHLRSLLLVAGMALTLPAQADDWPCWRGPTRDGRWHEKGIVERFERAVLEPVWRARIGSGYSGPTVADGRVYVTDRVVRPVAQERVHCFDAGSGAPLWTHEYPCEYQGISYEAGPRAAVAIADGRLPCGAPWDLIVLATKGGPG